MAARTKPADGAAGRGRRGLRRDACSGSPRSRTALRKGSSIRSGTSSAPRETLKEVADCEEELQAHAQALMAALGSARDAQQAQAETVRVRALEIQARSEDLRPADARLRGDRPGRGGAERVGAAAGGAQADARRDGQGWRSSWPGSTSCRSG